jgi:beta-barrel assembly-enhancing protease
MRYTLALSFAVLLSGAAFGQLRSLKPGFNLFTPEQDVQLGREAKTEVEKTKPVVRDARLDQYIAGIGARLAQSPRAGAFPFSFEMIRDKNINAFALPGGPIFINTATVAAADNEAQLAGVMAHEMSHVALRHGTHEASKSKAVEIGAALAGGMTGNSIMGALARAGISLGANSMLLHYSREAESQADYNGAQIMANAGYNPVEMARFFQKLETKSSEGRFAQFLSDHPTPGNRVQAVEQEIQYMPPKNYSTDSGQFQQVRNLVANMPGAH